MAVGKPQDMGEINHPPVVMSGLPSSCFIRRAGHHMDVPPPMGRSHPSRLDRDHHHHHHPLLGRVRDEETPPAVGRPAPPRGVPIRQRSHRDGPPLEVDPGPHPAWRDVRRSGVRRRRAVPGGGWARPTDRVVRLWAGRGSPAARGTVVGRTSGLGTEYRIRIRLCLYWGFSFSVGLIHERGDQHLRRDGQCRRRPPPPALNPEGGRADPPAHS